MELKYADDIPYLEVERFDRQVIDGKIHKIQQEDFCQALGQNPQQKYEQEGGPGLVDCFALINSASSKPALDKKRLLQAIIFNYIIGNNDAHAKNFSLLYTNSNRFKAELSPLYDLICTKLYSNLSAKMSMRIGKKYRSDQVREENWIDLADKIGFKSRQLLLENQKLYELVQSKIELIKEDCMSQCRTEEQKQTIEKIISLLQY